MSRKRSGVIDGREIAVRARDILESKHGAETRVFDVRGISSVTDYTVVTTGNSPPHLKALFEEVRQVLKREGADVFRKSGAPLSGWLLLDYVDAVIHIFDRERREYYAVEELWAAAPQL
mgnify:CR=1 FL=1